MWSKSKGNTTRSALLIKNKITITQLNSKGKEQIIDVKLCETRDEAEQFIKDCKALPKEYRPTAKAPTCFYKMTHR
jgi:hypothetical protein